MEKTATESDTQQKHLNLWSSGIFCISCSFLVYLLTTFIAIILLLFFFLFPPVFPCLFLYYMVSGLQPMYIFTIKIILWFISSVDQSINSLIYKKWPSQFHRAQGDVFKLPFLSDQKSQILICSFYYNVRQRKEATCQIWETGTSQYFTFLLWLTLLKMHESLLKSYCSVMAQAHKYRTLKGGGALPLNTHCRYMKRTHFNYWFYTRHPKWKQQARIKILIRLNIWSFSSSWKSSEWGFWHSQ